MIHAPCSVRTTYLVPHSLAEFMSCAWKWVKTNYAARRFLANLVLIDSDCSSTFDWTSSRRWIGGWGFFAERLWCERCQKDFHQRQQFRGINHGRQVWGWVPWSSTQKCHKVEQCRRRNAPRFLDCLIAIFAGCDRHLNRTQRGLWRGYYSG